MRMRFSAASAFSIELSRGFAPLIPKIGCLGISLCGFDIYSNLREM
jgi:hypothetical protein